MYRERYWKEQYFTALSKIEVVAKKHNLTLAEIALRWISHHSALKRAHGDSVLIGASSVKHIEQNLLDLEKGTLREFVCSISYMYRALIAYPQRRKLSVFWMKLGKASDQWPLHTTISPGMP